MTFGNPHLTPLLLFALAPLLLHILERRRARTVVWPAMRFLLLAPKARLRRLRWRELAILLCRTLAVLALVLAILQPRSEQPTLGAHGVDRAPRAVVLVLDTSFSMQYRDPGSPKTSLDKARQRAREELDQARPGDEILLVTAAGRWLAYGPSGEATSGTAQESPVERALARLETGPERFRLLPALERTAGQAEALLNRRREVLVLSDFQRDTLLGAEPRDIESLHAALSGTSGETIVRWIDCGHERPRNRFLSVAETPALAVDRYRATQLGVVAHDVETPDDESSSTVVDLHVDEELLARARENSTPPASHARFSVRLPSGGTRALTFTLKGEDGLAADNHSYLAIEVPAALDILLLASTEAGPQRAAFLKLALYPTVAGQPAPEVPFRPALRQTLSNVTLDDYRVVFVCGLDALRFEDVSRLESFVRAGGGVAFFASAPPPLPTVTERLFAAGKGLLPALIRSRTTAAATPLYLADIDLEHPLLELFAKPENGDLGQVPFLLQRATEPPGPDTRILATLGGGPWLLEKRFGRGRCILVTAGVAGHDTELARHPLFVPFVHRLTRYLAGGKARERNVLLGEPLRWSIREPEGTFDGTLTGPDGRQHPLQAAAGWNTGRLEFQFDATSQPGHYLMELKEAGREPRTESFAVNTPTHESDLSRPSRAELAAIATRWGATVHSPRDALRRSIQRARTAQTYWGYALSAALVLFFLEQLLVRRYGDGA